MAKGYYRNWEEVECDGCGEKLYRKYAEKIGDKLYCPNCAIRRKGNMVSKREATDGK